MSTPEMSGREIIKVRLLRAGKVIRSYRVRSDTLTIGSEKGATIRAAGDSSVLPKHATIFAEDGEVTLVPEPGAKVLLNGEEVDFAVPGPSDVIKIGRLTFSVELGESADSVPPKAAATQKKPSIPPQRPTMPPARQPAAAQQPPMVSTPVAKPEPKPAPKAAPKPAPKPAMIPEPSPEAAKATPKSAPVPMVKPLIVEPTKKPSVPPSMDDVEPDEPGEDTTKQFVPEKESFKEPPKKVEPTPAPAVTEQATSAPAQPEVAPSPAPSDEPEYEDDLEADSYFYDDSADEEQDEFLFEEAFDLIEELSAPPPVQKDAPKEQYCAAHVMRITAGRITDTAGVLPNRSFKSLSGELKCRVSGGKIMLSTKDSVSGTITSDGRETDLRTVSMKRTLRTASLGEGDTALLQGSEGTYRIDVYRPPRAERAGGFNFNPKLFIILGVAAGIHLVGALAAAIIMPEEKENIVAEEETYAEVKLEEPETPQEEIKQEEPQKPKDTLSLSEKAPAVTKKAVSKIREKASNTTTSSSVDSLLSVLTKGSGKPGASDNLKDMVSNIDAVAPASGIAGGFNIAGAIASLPGGDVNIAKSGGGGIVSTLSGEQVAGKGTALTKLQGKKKKGKVRGKVTKMSSGAKVKGSLSKAEVARVVNANAHQLQACYEKALMGNPGLSGRVIFEWTITSSGKVKGVRTASSTLGSAGATNCMMKKIKRWKFPKPVGGDATIRFPFLFRSVSS